MLDFFRVQNKSITASVASFLKEALSVPANQYQTEDKVERVIARQLKENFGEQNVTTQYSIGGNMPLRSDIDLYNGQVGIELKLAKQLLGEKGCSNIERLFGQVIYYSKLKYHSNLIVLVVGSLKDKGDPKLKEIEDFLTSLDVTFVYSALRSKVS